MLESPEAVFYEEKQTQCTRKLLDRSLTYSLLECVKECYDWKTSRWLWYNLKRQDFDRCIRTKDSMKACFMKKNGIEAIYYLIDMIHF